ncbi:MAG: hypothetical protein K9G61_06505 [Bacteroidales bacterium]|nr:hypothetical protein [Bacteroidales bacterium]
MTIKPVFLLMIILAKTPMLLLSQTAPFEPSVPAVYSGIMVHPQKGLYHLPVISGDTFWLKKSPDTTNPFKLLTLPRIEHQNLIFDFGNPKLFGTLVYGTFPEEQMKYSFPAFSKNCRIISGKAQADLSGFLSKNKSQPVIFIAYQVHDQYGQRLYQGKVAIKTSNPPVLEPYLVEGPMVNVVTDSSARLSFIASKGGETSLMVNDKLYNQAIKTNELNTGTFYEFDVRGLHPLTEYSYTITYGEFSETYSFVTAPASGSSHPFVFAFTSGSMANKTDIAQSELGINTSMLERLGIFAGDNQVSFIQFSGNLISGYCTEKRQAAFQYHNWKKAVEFFGHYLPVYTTIGHHESLRYVFDDGQGSSLSVDQFPFNTQAAEAVFSAQLINPENGPESEDGSRCDPYKNRDDFPRYDEQVYHYQYGNLAVVVLNTQYWVSMPRKAVQDIGGNVSGYIMDNQLAWLQKTLTQLDENETVDHIVVVCDAPLFPVNGNFATGMWYGGNNLIKPIVAAEPAMLGILERRDELIDCMINETEKVVLLLSSSEAGYSRLSVEREMPLYPEIYRSKKTKIKKSVTQLCCSLVEGQVDANENYPWQDFVAKTSSQATTALISVNGEQLSISVVNPKTNTLIDTFQIK